MLLKLIYLIYQACKCYWNFILAFYFALLNFTWFNFRKNEVKLICFFEYRIEMQNGMEVCICMQKASAHLPDFPFWLSGAVSGNWTCFLDGRPVTGLFSKERVFWPVVGLCVGVAVALVSLLVGALRELKQDVAVVVGGWIAYLTAGTFKGHFIRPIL